MVAPKGVVVFVFVDIKIYSSLKAKLRGQVVQRANILMSYCNFAVRFSVRIVWPSIISK